MTQNACDKTVTLFKMKNCAEYTMICTHYFVWSIVLDLSNEYSKKKKNTRKEILREDLQKLVEKYGI